MHYVNVYLVLLLRFFSQGDTKCRCQLFTKRHGRCTLRQCGRRRSVMLPFTEDPKIIFLFSPAEVDPRLGHALKVAQLSAQYIVAGNQLLKSKHATIQKGIAAFDEEEDRLDLELSKLRFYFFFDMFTLVHKTLSQFCFEQGKVPRAAKRIRRSGWIGA